MGNALKPALLIANSNNLNSKPCALINWRVGDSIYSILSKIDLFITFKKSPKFYLFGHHFKDNFTFRLFIPKEKKDKIKTKDFHRSNVFHSH